jgi:hypothetical protein
VSAIEQPGEVRFATRGSSDQDNPNPSLAPPLRRGFSLSCCYLAIGVSGARFFHAAVKSTSCSRHAGRPTYLKRSHSQTFCGMPLFQRCIPLFFSIHVRGARQRPAETRLTAFYPGPARAGDWRDRWCASNPGQHIRARRGNRWGAGEFPCPTSCRGARLTALGSPQQPP